VKKASYDEERTEIKEMIDVLKKESMWLRKEVLDME
jgi:hypothetical protein